MKAPLSQGWPVTGILLDPLCHYLLKPVSRDRDIPDNRIGFSRNNMNAAGISTPGSHIRSSPGNLYLTRLFACSCHKCIRSALAHIQDASPRQLRDQASQQMPAIVRVGFYPTWFDCRRSRYLSSVIWMPYTVVISMSKFSGQKT